MKLSNHLEADGRRITGLGAPTDAGDALTDASLVPFELTDGETFRVPAGRQILHHLPITMNGESQLRLDGALVEV